MSLINIEADLGIIDIDLEISLIDIDLALGYPSPLALPGKTGLPVRPAQMSLLL